MRHPFRKYIHLKSHKKKRERERQQIKNHFLFDRLYYYSIWVKREKMKDFRVGRFFAIGRENKTARATPTLQNRRNIMAHT